MYSQFLVVVLLQLVVLNVVMLKLVKKLKSLVFEDTNKTICTGVEMFRKIIDEGQAGDNVGVLLRGVKRKKLNVVKYLQNQVQLNHIKNLKQKYMFCQKKKVVVILHSSVTTAHNSTSEQLT